MKRRLVIATCLAGVIAGSAGAALASGAPVTAKKHQICIALASNNDYNNADYYCVDYTPAAPH